MGREASPSLSVTIYRLSIIIYYYIYYHKNTHGEASWCGDFIDEIIFFESPAEVPLKNHRDLGSFGLSISNEFSLGTCDLSTFLRGTSIFQVI